MHILIVKMSSLGDIIHAFPVLEYIRQYYSDAKIDWIVEQSFVELVQAHPMVNRAIGVPIKRWKSSLYHPSTWKEIKQFRQTLRQTTYDLVIDLQGNIKSGLMTFLTKSDLKIGFGYTSVPEWPNLLTTHQRYNPPKGQNIREDYLFIAKSALNHWKPFAAKGIKLKLSDQSNQQLLDILENFPSQISLKVMVCSGSNWPNKQLSYNTLKDFLDRVSQHLNAHFLLVWGNQAEKETAEQLAIHLPQKCFIMNKLSLASLQNLMAHVDLVIAMDSLPLHLAGTTPTPTYSLFGASSSNKYKPMGERHHAYQGICPYGKQFDKRCDILRTCKTGACIKQLEGSQIFNHFVNWWTTSRE